MKKYSGIFTLLVASMVIFSSCKKELDLQPTDTFNEANAYLTLDDIQQGVNTAYGRHAGAVANDMYANSLTSDEARIGSGNAGSGQIEYRFGYRSDATTGSGVQGSFGAYYGVIDQVNRVLPKIATVSGFPNDGPVRDNYRGQLLALRAISYFGLIQAFSGVYDPAGMGVPIVLDVDPFRQPARNTMGEVMAQIEADMAEAKTLLPTPTAADYVDTTLNYLNTTAFHARIALYRKDYDAAIAYATEVISSNVRPLVSGTDFQNIWDDVVFHETLFRTKSRYGGALTSAGGTIHFAPSDKLVSTYSNQDVRLFTYIGINGSGDYYVEKFFPAVYMKPSRTAEMYLIRAEANARKATPDIAAAAADLNLLRTNRIAGYTNETFTDVNILINAIMEERYKELAFEGFRFFDLKRNGLPVQRGATDANPEWRTLLPESHLFVYPVPNDEILANPNFIQNTGY